MKAIAQQFGVDWRPASSADRAVLDRPGRTAAPRRRAGRGEKRAPCGRRLGRLRYRVVRLHPAACADRGRNTSGGVRHELRRQCRPFHCRAFGHRRGDGPDQSAPRRSGWTTRSSCRSPPRGCSPAACCAPKMSTWRECTPLVRGEVAHRLGDAIGMQLKQPLAAGQPFALSGTDAARAGAEGCRSS